MPFEKVGTDNSNSGGGNFKADLRKIFNKCGETSYMGALKFKDSAHNDKIVPIFHDDCLENLPAAYGLLKSLRKTLKMSFIFSSVYITTEDTRGSARSIHQNEYGYLPFAGDGAASRPGVAAPAVMANATLYGQLPNNQKSAKSVTQGQFLEYTFPEPLHVECRFIVDYRFGLIYMTLGHYNRDSFAMLARSQAELDFEIKPTLSVLNVNFEA